jgi:hypothetical protein
MSEDEFRALTLAPNAGNFTSELHYSTYKVDKVPHIQLNRTIFDYYEVYTNPKFYEAFVKYQQESFIHKFLDTQPIRSDVVFTNDMMKTMTSVIKKDAKGESFNGILQSLNISAESYAKFIDKGMNHLLYVRNADDSVEINPLINKWLAVNDFLRHEYMYLSTKPEYIHPTKVFRSVFSDDAETFVRDLHREAAPRMIQQGKRNVSHTGTTELPYRNSQYGAPENVNVAVINDV